MSDNGRFNPQDFVIDLSKPGQAPRLYLQGKHRVMWARDKEWTDAFNHEIGIEIEELEHDRQAKYAKIKATIRSRKDGFILAQATKTETAADFKDYYEKAEAGSVSRALGFCGFGTAYALELEGEGAANRPVDGPMQNRRDTSTPQNRESKPPRQESKPPRQESKPPPPQQKTNGNGKITKQQIDVIAKLLKEKNMSGEEFRKRWGDPKILPFEEAKKIIVYLQKWDQNVDSQASE